MSLLSAIRAIVEDRAREQELLSRCLELEQALLETQAERDDWRELAGKRAQPTRWVDGPR